MSSFFGGKIMDAKVIWKQGLSFTGTADTGFELPLGAGADVGGAGDGFEPIELMGVSLAGCTAMDVASILKKKQQDLTAFEVRVHADRSEQHPKIWTRALIRYLVTGHGVDEAAVLRAIELSASKYCPAQAMLGKVVPLELRYEIYEAQGDGNRKLVKEGKFEPKTP
jgi:putative redox protein